MSIEAWGRRVTNAAALRIGGVVRAYPYKPVEKSGLGQLIATVGRVVAVHDTGIDFRWYTQERGFVQRFVAFEDVDTDACA